MIYYRKTLFGRGPKLTAVQFDIGIGFYSPLTLFLGTTFTLVVVMIGTLGRESSVQSATPIDHPMLLAIGILTS